MKLISLLLLFGVILQTACTPPPASSEETVPTGEIVCDALLFDARLHRQQKWNTFRLELYVTDTVVGVSGRGYLGKGALKARLTDDSVVVYFPSTDEYLRDRISSVVSSAECIDDTMTIAVVALLNRPPAQLPNDGQVRYQRTVENNDEVITVNSDSCGWSAVFAYERDNGNSYLREIRFKDNVGNELKATRRELRRNVGVSSSRFQVKIPESAIPLEP